MTALERTEARQSQALARTLARQRGTRAVGYSQVADSLGRLEQRAPPRASSVSSAVGERCLPIMAALFSSRSLP